MNVLPLRRSALALGVALALAGFAADAAGQNFRTFYVETFNSMQADAPLDGQRGWRANDDQVIVVPRDGSSNLQVELTSRGPVFGFEELARSPDGPTVTEEDNQSDLISFSVVFDSTECSWYVTPINESRNTALTRLWFRRGGTLEILVPDGQGVGFVPVPDFTWETDVRYSFLLLTTNTGVLGLSQVLEDDERVTLFEGVAFASGVEALTIECGNERSGTRMFFDNVRGRFRRD